MKLILGSASERRNELLKRITEDFHVVVSDFDENSIKFQGKVNEYVMEISKGKALAVSNSIKDDDCVIIGCDTVVSLDNCILGKPKSQEEAYNMIKSLSGREHEVYSGIAIINTKSNYLITDYVCTKVLFSSLSHEEIMTYINTEEPFDKAGAYGIQGNAGVFVESIQGCYYNVVGLPLNKLKKMLRDIEA